MHVNKESTKHLEHDLALSQWGLPEGVMNHYKKRGITEMFPWQSECLSMGSVLEGENLIYSAPTSAGKTLVAEILVSQTVFDKQKKALIILPFVSVVREKMFYFQEMFSENGIRVEGFMGGHTPSASFQQVQVGVCTIEKANSLINRMLEEKSLSKLGIVVVDELHLLGDPYRGYLLELLLTKLKYMSSIESDLQLQIVGMSATLPNLNMLAKWLNAKLYYTNFRPVPLLEHLKCGRNILNTKLEKVGEVPGDESESGDDSENVGQLCIETIKNGHSTLIFCPTKVWCENLAVKLAAYFRKLGCGQDAVNEGTLGWVLREQLDLNKLNSVVEHLKISPVGLDKELAKTVPFGVAFHHAGLTLDERDIIEGSFKNGSLRVVCATSTLSSGVNLPARRVIIRSPMSFGGIMDIMTYRQMIGRAGRMGVDTEGESILICKPTERAVCQRLMSTALKPIESCLGSGRLSASLKRAILEVIASGIASTSEDVARYAASTFLASCSRSDMQDPLTSCLNFLEENELIRLKDGTSYAPTPLGEACLASSLPPDEGLALFRELERARRCFVLDSDLHIIYQITPYSVSEQWSKIDWLRVLNMLEELSPSMRRVAELVGVEDSFLVKVVRGSVNTSNPDQRSKLSIHRRFYTALALQDLVNEVSLPEVARKFDCNKGMLQSLQQSAATYAGMVAEFARRLRWGTIELIVSHFQERLQFGVQRELCELMRLPSLNGVRARALFNAGFTSLPEIAKCDVPALEEALLAATPFQSRGQGAGETGHEAERRKRHQAVWVTGRSGLTIRAAAEILVKEARDVLELEMGVGAKWDSSEKKENIAKNSKNGTLSNCKNSQIISSQLAADGKADFSKGTEGETPKKTEIKNNPSSACKKTTNQLSIANESGMISRMTPEKNVATAELLSGVLAKVASTVHNNLSEKASSEGVLKHQMPPSGSDRIENRLKTPRKDSVEKTDPLNGALPIKHHETMSGDENIVTGVYEEDCVVVEAYGTDGSTVRKPDDTKTNVTSLNDVILESCCDWESFSKEQDMKDQNECTKESSCFTKSTKIDDEGRTEDKKDQDIDYFATTFNVDHISTIVGEKKLSKSPSAVARNRFSTDIFDVSPKPCSTPLPNSKSSATVNSPDLFSQSLTFDTQLEQICDSEELVPVFTEDVPSSPPKSDDLGYLSDSSPVIVAEISTSDLIPRMLETVGESFFVNGRAQGGAMKRKASPDVIAGSDDSLAEEANRSKRKKLGKSCLFRSRSRRQVKRERRNVAVVSLVESDEEIASTPFVERVCSFASRRGHTLHKNILDNSAFTTETQEVEEVEMVEIKPDLLVDIKPESENVEELCAESLATNRGGDARSTESFKLQEMDWKTLDVVDICGHQDVFQSFREELKEQTFVGIAFGCRRKTAQPKPSIGAKFRKVSPSKKTEDLEAEDNTLFVHEDVVLDGVAFYWYKNVVFYMACDSGVVGKEEKLAVLEELSRKRLRVFDVRVQLRMAKLCTGVDLSSATFEDPKVAGWLLSTTGTDSDLRSMVRELLEPAAELADLLGGVRDAGSVALAIDSTVIAKTRACCEAALTFHVLSEQISRLQSIGLLSVFRDVEMPTLGVLAEMELEGLRFDEMKLKKVKSDLDVYVLELEKKAHTLAGRRFALSSYAAVSKVLYMELRLGKTSLHSKKKPSTSKEALELLETETKHPLPRIILHWRKLKAIINKTLFPLLQLLPATRVHGSCQTFTVTGRISMREPNLQNVPRDFDVVLDNEKRFSVRLRDMFVAPDRYTLLSADYCQIELRLLAHLSGDVALMTSITSSADVFVSIAAHIHGVGESEVSAEQRQRAKQTCYGIIYGIGARSLAQQLQVDEAAAQTLMDDFKAKFQGVQAFLLQTVAECRSRGFVETLSGRRRYLPAISSANGGARSEAERQAVNTRVQGSAADLVKTAMVAIANKARCLETADMKLILHLHDELIYQVRKDGVEDAARVVKTCMESAWSLSVPFPVKLKSGPSWGQLEAMVHVTI